MRAQELANDLAHQLELVESERDDLKLRLDEAEAVIDAVRVVRDGLTGWRDEALRELSKHGDERLADEAGLLDAVLRRIHQVDGL